MDGFLVASFLSVKRSLHRECCCRSSVSGTQAQGPSTEPTDPSASGESKGKSKKRKSAPNLDEIEDPAERRKQRRLAKNRATAAVSRYLTPFWLLFQVFLVQCSRFSCVSISSLQSFHSCMCVTCPMFRCQALWFAEFSHYTNAVTKSRLSSICGYVLAVISIQYHLGAHVTGLTAALSMCSPSG